MSSDAPAGSEAAGAAIHPFTASGRSYPSLSEAAKRTSLGAVRQNGPALPPLQLDIPVTPAEVDRLSRSLDDFCEKLSNNSASVATMLPTGVQDDGVSFMSPHILLRDCSAYDFSATAPVLPQVTSSLSPFPVFNPADLPAKPSAAVWMRHKQKWAPFKQTLPVYAQRASILASVRKSKVTTVVSGKHAGKSTQMPQLLLDTDLYKKKRILVVSSCDTAAVLLAERLRAELGLDEKLVAHAIPNDIRVASGTQVVVTTPTLFCRQMQCDPLLLDVGVVVLDDMAQRTVFSDVCLYQLRELLAASIALGVQTPAQQQRVPAPLRAAAASVEKMAVVALCSDDVTESFVARYFTQRVGPNGEILPPALASALLQDQSGAAGASAISVSREVVADIATASTTAQDATTTLFAAPLLLIDDAVAWIRKCETAAASASAPALPIVPQDVTRELTAVYADDIACLTQVQLAEDAAAEMHAASDKTYWWDLTAKLLALFDAANAAEVAAAAAKAAAAAPTKGKSAAAAVGAPATLSSVVVVLPSIAHVEIAATRLREALARLPATLAAARFRFVPYLHVLLRAAGFADLLPAEGAATQPDTRLVVLTTSQAALAYLPLTNVGLVVDWARTVTRVLDLPVESDRETLELVSKPQLRQRRALHTDAASRSMVVQFVTRGAMHATNRIRQETPHPLQHLSLGEWCDLLRLLRVMLSSAGPVAAANSTALKPAQRLTKLLTSIAIDAGSNTLRQDHLARTFALVEQTLAASGEGSAPSSVKLTALGALAFMLPFGTAATTRIVLAGALLDELPLACLLAAFHANGDAFLTTFPCQASESMQEARKYFRLTDESDFAGFLNLYRMWLQTSREGTPEDVAELLETAQASAHGLQMLHDAATRLFLTAKKALFTAMDPNAAAATSSSSASRKALQSLASTATFDDLCASAFANAMTLEAEDDDALALSGGEATSTFTPILRDIVAMALYPNVAVVEADGGVAVTKTPAVDAVAAAGGSASFTLQVPAAFHFTSATSGADAESADRRVCVYAERVANGGASDAASVSLLARSPLTMPGAVLLCGQGQLIAPAHPRRCRGWLPAISTAWRDTRAARALPPTTAITPKPVHGMLYDPTEAGRSSASRNGSAGGAVSLVLDQAYSITMAQCTAELLIKLRRSLLHRLEVLVKGCGKADDATPVNEIRACLVWLHNREARREKFLRERRGIENSSGSSAARRRPVTLFPYLSHKHEPGQLPEKISAAAVAADDAAAAAATASHGSGGRDAAGGARGTAAAASTAPATAFGASAGSHFSGTEPTDEVKATILRTAKIIGTAGSRQKEAELLKHGVAFAFLDPMHEHHAYYTFVLRKEAPHLDWLGDDLGELEAYLQGLEVEMLAELQQEQEQLRAATQQQQQQQGHASDAWGGSYGDGEGYHEASNANNANNNNFSFYADQDGEGDSRQQQQPVDRFHFLSAPPGGLLDPAAATAGAAASPSSAATSGAPLDHHTNPYGGGYSGDQHQHQQQSSVILHAMPQKRGLHDGLLAVPASDIFGFAPSGGGGGVMGAPPLPVMPPRGGAVSGGFSIGGMPTISIGGPGGAATKGDLPKVTVATAGGNTKSEGSTVRFMSIDDTHSTMSGSGCLMEKLMAMRGGPMPGPAAADTAAAAAPPPPAVDLAGLPPPPPVDGSAAMFGGRPSPSGGGMPGAGGMFFPPPTHGGGGMAYPPGPFMPQMAVGGGMPMQMQMFAPNAAGAFLPGMMMNIPGFPQPFPGAPPPPPFGSYNSGGAATSLFGAAPPPQPSTEELQALFVAPLIVVPPAAPAVHPLAKPPPRIPQELIDSRPPSVLVTPLPKDTALNLPLILAKALGEKMSVKVGPTYIIGDAARIDVPNRSVEKRAIDIGAFYCLGQEIKVLFNDRIIDNPNGVTFQKFASFREKLKDAVPRHMERVKYSPEKAGGGGDGGSYAGSNAAAYSGGGGRSGAPSRPPRAASGAPYGSHPSNAPSGGKPSNSAGPPTYGEDPRFQNFRAGGASAWRGGASGAAAAAAGDAAAAPLAKPSNIGVASDSDNSSSDGSSSSSSSSSSLSSDSD